ncbi:hypothetical protein [Acinetobacter kyonggiensis]|uniref:VOC domain-containing protein n=1 Tax=Acinetobacter kyonggiensis TaxID=595670 RepID=A0A1H3IY79_9GAMM|nr:hypothetical protein [Acinetobacter kyonggiensis]SDY32612.1 hypothetical protein SAMN05421643_107165 [Acinetobacter kyonggiensis]
MDYIAANLPAIDFEATRNFYAMLGFQCIYQSDIWMMLEKDSFKLEFFHHPELDSKTSWHSACIRVQDLSILDQAWRLLDWSVFPNTQITEIEQLGGMKLFCVIDLNGSLLRCIEHH